MQKTNALIIAAYLIMLTAYSQSPRQEMKTTDLINLDTTISPAADFDAYANNKWEENNPLPADKSRFGTFDKLADQASEQVKYLFA
ncbi:MAG: hypothetical protein AB7D05_04820 [Mangrovibacterium sp.]